MSLDINVQSKNNAAVVGTLLSTNIVSRNTSDGRPYKSGDILVRVVQKFGGREEVSEIGIPFFATKTTNSGKKNPVYDNIEQVEQFRTAQAYGLAEADKVRIDARASLEENAFYNRNTGKLVSSWRTRCAFINKATTADPEIATFNTDIFVLNTTNEVNRDGDETGRLIIQGAIVVYGGKVHVLKFVVENADLINFIQNNWEINQSWNIRGRIRSTTVTENRSADSGIGEEVPQTYTRSVRELVVTWCDSEMKSEDDSYTIDDIKIAMATRKANNERLIAEGQAKAEAGAAKTAAKTAPPATSGYEWDE